MTALSMDEAEFIAYAILNQIKQIKEGK